jgi:hypothetical protein
MNETLETILLAGGCVASVLTITNGVSYLATLQRYNQEKRKDPENYLSNIQDLHSSYVDNEGFDILAKVFTDVGSNLAKKYFEKKER